MAFARVLFLANKKWGTVSTDKISHYSKTTFVPAKKYHYLKPNGIPTKVAISFVRDTRAEIEREIKAKRCRIPPISTLSSASEITDEDNERRRKPVRNNAESIDTKAILRQRMADLQRKNALKQVPMAPVTCVTPPLLDSPVNSSPKYITGEEYPSGELDVIEQQMLIIHGNELMGKDSTEINRKCEKQTGERDNQNVNSNGSNSSTGSDNNRAQQDEFARKPPNLRIIAEEELSNAADGSGPSKTEHLRGLHRSYLKEGKQKIALAKESPPFEIYDFQASSDSSEAEETCMKETNKDRHNKRKFTDDENTVKSSKSTKRHKKNLSALDEYSKSDNESGRKFEQIVEAARKVEKSILRIREEILTPLKKLEAEWDQLKNTPSVDPSDHGLELNRIRFHPAVGYLRKNGDAGAEIHLGQGIWISEDNYNNASNKSNGVFVKEMAVLLFGEDLKYRTVTGMKAPRTGIKSDALDGKKITAIREIFMHFLRTRRCMREEKIQKEIMKVNGHLREKINDMKKSSAAQGVANETPSIPRGKRKCNKNEVKSAKGSVRDKSQTPILSKGRPENERSSLKDYDARSEGDSGSRKTRERRYSF